MKKNLICCYSDYLLQGNDPIWLTCFTLARNHQPVFLGGRWKPLIWLLPLWKNHQVAGILPRRQGRVFQDGLWFMNDAQEKVMSMVTWMFWWKFEYPNYTRSQIVQVYVWCNECNVKIVIFSWGCYLSKWWFQMCLLFSPRSLGKWSNLTNIFFKCFGSTTNKMSVFQPSMFRYYMFLSGNFMLIPNPEDLCIAYLWTPKPWKVKVLSPSNKGYNL